MALIHEIRRKFSANQVEFTKHAIARTLLRNIPVYEIREAIAKGEVIENYLDDKYGPSCLVFGRAKSQRPLHIQCSHPTRGILKVITVYEPDSDEWVEFRQRRIKDDKK